MWGKLFVALMMGIGLVAANPAYGQDDWIISGREAALDNNILITIDDCINEEIVTAMAGLLRDAGLRATFFPNTDRITNHNPQLWRDIVAAGNEIGYHTRHHDAGMTPDELAADFGLFQDELRQILGDSNYTIRYVRPPEGLWNNNWLEWARGSNLFTVKWNVVPPVEFSYLRDVLENPNGGGILLLHARHEDLKWLSDNLESMRQMTNTAGANYQITSLTGGLND